MGRLTKEKGFERLLRVVKRLIDENFNLTLYILGDRGDKQTLINFINKNHLSDRIKLLGFKENPYKYVAASDLFVCSSYTEGFSTAVSEAVILGTPVVTTLCSGMKEILGVNNEYGLIVDNNEEALYLGIRKMLVDGDLYRYYKNKVKERRNFFSVESTVKEVEKLFDGDEV